MEELPLDKSAYCAQTYFPRPKAQDQRKLCAFEDTSLKRLVNGWPDSSDQDQYFQRQKEWDEAKVS